MKNPILCLLSGALVALEVHGAVAVPNPSNVAYAAFAFLTFVVTFGMFIKRY